MSRYPGGGEAPTSFTMEDILKDIMETDQREAAEEARVLNSKNAGNESSHVNNAIAGAGKGRGLTSMKGMNYVPVANREASAAAAAAADGTADSTNKGSPSSSSSSPPSSDNTPGYKRRQAEIQEQFNNRNVAMTEGHKAKQLFQMGTSFRTNQSAKELMNLNPLWMNFSNKCVQKVTSAEEMRRLLNYHSHTDEVFLVRYHQNGCTACNAVDKAFEFMCHESRRYFPKLTYYEVNKDESPELTKGMMRFPQVKGFAGGQWHDIDFKPPTDFREKLLRDVEHEVQRLANRGHPVTAVQAEEMYFSAAGPSMLLLLEENIYDFYTKAQVRLHNYWKQVSVRRTWFYKKHIEPRTTPEIVEQSALRPVFGEKIMYGPQKAPNPNDA